MFVRTVATSGAMMALVYRSYFDVMDLEIVKKMAATK